MISDRYRLSFTTGGLFLQEAVVVTERYLALRDWKITREQMRTSAAATRSSQELIARRTYLEQFSIDPIPAKAKNCALKKISGLEADDEE